jgi:hypothetical protein
MQRARFVPLQHPHPLPASPGDLKIAGEACDVMGEETGSGGSRFSPSRSCQAGRRTSSTVIALMHR